MPLAEVSDGMKVGVRRVLLPGGRAIGGALTVASLVGLLYGGVLSDLAADWWNEPALSYGMLIPPLALYVAWLQQKTICAAPKMADWRGTWLVAAACLLFLTGKLAAEFFLARISFVLLLAGFVWTFWGRARLGKLAFPFVLLATMVPLPALIYYNMAAPLQLLASKIATGVAELAGVSVYRDGNIIHLAGLSLGVEEACSGLNTLSSLMVASLLLGFLRGLSTPARAVLFVLAIPLSILTNIIRVSGTAILADYHPDYAMGFYHSFSGWLVFILGFAMLYGCSLVPGALNARRKA